MIPSVKQLAESVIERLDCDDVDGARESARVLVARFNNPNQVRRLSRVLFERMNEWGSGSTMTIVNVAKMMEVLMNEGVGT